MAQRQGCGNPNCTNCNYFRTLPRITFEEAVERYRGTSFETTLTKAFDGIDQQPPSQQEWRAHHRIMLELNPNQRKVVEALESLAKQNGGDAMVTDKYSGRPSSLDYLYLILNEEWPDSEVIQAKGNILLLTLKEDDFDTKGDFRFPCANGDTQTRGGMVYKQPSSDWVRVGLRVSGKYDNRNDDWLMMNGNPNEWAVGFHGSNVEGLRAIASTGNFRVSGDGQRYAGDNDINEKSAQCGQPCGNGAYFGESIATCESYSRNGRGNNNKIIVLQVRMKPSETRIPAGEPDYRIVNEPKYIRPYGLCVKMRDTGGDRPTTAGNFRGAPMMQRQNTYVPPQPSQNQSSCVVS